MNEADGQRTGGTSRGNIRTPTPSISARSILEAAADGGDGVGGSGGRRPRRILPRDGRRAIAG